MARTQSRMLPMASKSMPWPGVKSTEEIRLAMSPSPRARMASTICCLEDPAGKRLLTTPAKMRSVA